MNRMSMSARFGGLLALSGIVSAALIFVASVLFSQNMQQDLALTGHKQIQNAVSAQLIRDVDILSATLAENLKQPLYTYDFSAIKLVIDELAKSGELDYVYVFDAQNKIVHDGSIEIDLFGRDLSQVPKIKLKLSNKIEIKRIGGIIHVIEPIETKGVIFGGITFGIKYTKAEQDILKYSNEILLANDYYNKKLIISMIAVLAALMVAVLPMAFFLARKLLFPLQELAAKSQLMTDHNKAVSFTLERDDEIGQLATSLDKMTLRLTQSHHKMTTIAYQDELTSLANRRCFNDFLKKLVAKQPSNDNPFAMLFIDLDHFKQINDNEGHDVGDALLIGVADRMTEATRHYCSQYNYLEYSKAMVARLGGDEFVVVLPYGDNVFEMMDFSEYVLEQFNHPFIFADKVIRATLSIGVTLYPSQAQTINDLLKNADLAMYESKKKGRGCATLFNLGLKEEYQLKNIIQLELDSALNTGQLCLDYQPFYSFNAQKLIGGEASIFWQHPDYGVISPDVLAEMLVDPVLINTLTLWTIKEVCLAGEQLADKGIESLLSVHIPTCCLMDTDTVEKIQALINHHNQPTATICFELKETIMMKDIPHSKAVLESWKAGGVKIWIADFGTGYSSLNYLNDLPIDALKIDQSFIVDLSKSHISPVLKSIHALANAMSILVISKGISTETQALCCQELGSNIGQGDLYSAVLTLKKFNLTMESIYNEKTS